MRVVIHTPTVEQNSDAFRYVLWCSRAIWKREHAHALSPLWFLTESGANPWLWNPNVFHYFCSDLGFTESMNVAVERCRSLGIPFNPLSLKTYDAKSWSAFEKEI
jgi:hypothetical protein